MTSRILASIVSNVKRESRALHCSSRLSGFWEKDRRGGYAPKYDRLEERSKVEVVRHGLRELADEIRLWKDEMREKFENDPVLVFRHNETDVVWRFNADEKSLMQWVTTSDSDHGEGFSKCSLQLTQHGRGLFSGDMQTRTPKDGKVKRAGYCNMRSLRARKSFRREAYLDWTQYNQLVMRVRGDGKSYLLNISTSGYFDILWHDTYHYILYTRGGPYWQDVKIPFSKFFLASKGRVQDKQGPIPLNRVVSFGISVGDKADGPFRLEIDYIGLTFDSTHTEKFAYEMYSTPKYIAGT